MNSFQKLFSPIYKKRYLSLLFIAVLIGVIALVVSFTQQRQTSDTKAQQGNDRITKLTDELIQSTEPVSPNPLSTLFGQNKPGQKDLVSIATEREQLLLQEIKTNPQVLLQNRISEATRAKLPPDVKTHIETDKQTTGTLTILHLDNFAEKKDAYVYLLDSAEESGNNDTYTLYFTQKLQEQPLVTDATISTEGVALQKALVVEPQKETDFQVTSLPAPLATRGTKRIAVMQVTTINDPPQQLTETEIMNMLFNNVKSVKNYYRKNSDNLIDYTGTYLGSFTVTPPTTDCSYNMWSDLADQQVQAKGISLNSYDNIVYVMDISCSNAAGIGTIGGKPARSWVHSNIGISTSVYAHEIGHNLGIHHANRFFCGNKQMDVEELCKSYEYGDASDVMGFGYLEFNAPHKEAMGWVPQNTIKRITEAGTYTISSLESSSSANQKVLKIDKSDTSKYYRSSYYISYRQPLGLFDKDLPPLFTTGASIHFASTDIADQTEQITADPNAIINVEPYNQATLLDNMSFIDQINGIQIKQLSHTASTVTVQVSFTPDVVFCPDVTFTNLPTEPVDAQQFILNAKVTGGRNWSNAVLLMNGNPTKQNPVGSDSTVLSWTIPNPSYTGVNSLDFVINYIANPAGGGSNNPATNITCKSATFTSISPYAASYSLSSEFIRGGEPFTIKVKPNPDLKHASFDNVALMVDGKMERLQLDSTDPLTFSWTSIYGLSPDDHYLQLVAHCEYKFDEKENAHVPVNCDNADIFFNGYSLRVLRGKFNAQYTFSPEFLYADQSFTLTIQPASDVIKRTYDYVALRVDNEIKYLEAISQNPDVYQWKSDNPSQGMKLGGGYHQFQLLAHCTYPEGKQPDCSKSDVKFNPIQVYISE